MNHMYSILNMHIPFTTATQLVKQYRTGRLTPDHIAQQCELNVARLKHLNVFTNVASPALTRTQAQAATERYEAGTSLGLLDGVPVAVKDNFCVQGLPTTCASKYVSHLLQTFQTLY